MQDLIEFSGIFGLVVGFVFLLFLVIGFPMALIANHLEIKDTPVQRDSLELDYIKILNMRTDFKQVSSILSRIVSFNMHVKSMQYWNTVLIINWIIPNEWDNIKTIDIKED